MSGNQLDTINPPQARLDLNGKKQATVAFRCDPDIKLGIAGEAAFLGVTPSHLMETVLRDFLIRESKPRLLDLHPLEEGTKDLHRLTVEICADGVITPIERARWTKKMTELGYGVWHDINAEE